MDSSTYLFPVVQITTAAQMNTELAKRVASGDFNSPPADPSMVVTSATVTLGTHELTLTVTGTLSSGGFTYTLVLTIGPSEIPFLWKDEAGPMRTRKVSASISFAAGTGLVDQTRAARPRNSPSAWPAQLPTEVILSVRRITITDTGLSGRGPGVYAWGRDRSLRPTPRRNIFPESIHGRAESCVVLALLAPLLLREGRRRCAAVSARCDTA